MALIQAETYKGSIVTGRTVSATISSTGIAGGDITGDNSVLGAIEGTTAIESTVYVGEVITGSIDSNAVAPIAGTLNAPEFVSEGEDYTGVYIVKPNVVQQSLDTKNKILRDDVIVLEIPYYEVSNESDGLTVVIGD